jgi:hypothetical protein
LDDVACTVLAFTKYHSHIQKTGLVPSKTNKTD